MIELGTSLRVEQLFVGRFPIQMYWVRIVASEVVYIFPLQEFINPCLIRFRGTSECQVLVDGFVLNRSTVLPFK
jgi:hypothetical protein